MKDRYGKEIVVGDDVVYNTGRGYLAIGNVVHMSIKSLIVQEVMKDGCENRFLDKLGRFSQVKVKDARTTILVS